MKTSFLLLIAALGLAACDDYAAGTGSGDTGYSSGYASSSKY